MANVNSNGSDGNTEPVDFLDGGSGGDGGTTGNADLINPAAELAKRGKRGRHPNSCECGNCVAKRNGSGNSAGSGAGTSTGAGPRPGGKKPSVAVEEFARQLVGGHAIAALLLKAPELAISEDEAKKLAPALIELSKHYNVSINPVWAAWFQVVTIAAMIYLPRVAMLAARLAAERKKKIDLTAAKVSEEIVKDAPMPDVMQQAATMNFAGV